MKQAVNLSAFRDAFRDYDRMPNFSYTGLKVLFDHLTMLEENRGEEFELDVISLCCEYRQSSVTDIIDGYGIFIPDVFSSDETMLEIVLNYIEENSFLVGYYDDQVVYVQF